MILIFLLPFLQLCRSVVRFLIESLHRSASMSALLLLSLLRGAVTWSLADSSAKTSSSTALLLSVAYLWLWGRTTDDDLCTSGGNDKSATEFSIEMYLQRNVHDPLIHYLTVNNMSYKNVIRQSNPVANNLSSNDTMDSENIINAEDAVEEIIIVIDSVGYLFKDVCHWEALRMNSESNTSDLDHKHSNKNNDSNSNSSSGNNNSYYNNNISNSKCVNSVDFTSADDRVRFQVLWKFFVNRAGRKDANADDIVNNEKKEEGNEAERKLQYDLDQVLRTISQLIHDIRNELTQDDSLSTRSVNGSLRWLSAGVCRKLPIEWLTAGKVLSNHIS